MKVSSAVSLRQLAKRVMFELCFFIKSRKFRSLNTNESWPVTLVTASDSSHFLPLVELLQSAKAQEPHWNIALWNLGFTSAELEYLVNRFPQISIRDFPFQSYPEHFKMGQSAGHYAWKPTLVWKESLERSGFLVWMDAGNRIVGSCEKLLKIARTYGFYSPYSDGDVKKWTHPTAIAKLRCQENLMDMRNLSGALIVWDLDSKGARKIFDRWQASAMDPDIFCPEGSNRANHRQDQAALTCIAYEAGYAVPSCLENLNSGLGVAIHMDGKLSEEVSSLRLR